MRCSNSLHLPVVRSTSGAADRGTWRHHFLARVGKVGAEAALLELPEEHRDACAALPIDELPVNLLAEVAYAWDVSSNSVRVIGMNVDRAYGTLGPFEIPGTADVVGVDQASDQAFVLDWKSQGYRGHARDSLQLRFLALCAQAQYGVGSVRVEIAALGDGGEVRRSWHVYDELDLAAFASELREWFVGASIAERASSEGAWCRNCPSFQSCPAKVALLHAAAGGGDLTAPFMGGLSRSSVGAAYVLSENLRSMARELDRRIAAAVEELGPCETPRGTVIKRALVEGNERLDGDTVWQTVEAMAGRDVADAAVERSATKKKLGEALRAKFGRGGAAKEREVLDAVRKAGGSKRTTSERMVEVDESRSLSKEAV